jgi:putative transposase
LREVSEIPEELRIYIDESGKNTDLNREYGYAPAGEPVEGKRHGRKPDKLNIVAAKCGDRIIERHEYGCSMTSRFFEFWFMLLLKCVTAGSVFIMDNATFHRKTVLKAMAEQAGCRVLFLPKYSPDLNPIEHEWANLKSFLRNHGRNFDSTSDAIAHYFQSA